MRDPIRFAKLTEFIYFTMRSFFLPPLVFFPPFPVSMKHVCRPFGKILVDRSIDRSIVRSFVRKQRWLEYSRTIEKTKSKKKKKSRISRIALIQTTETFLYPKFISFHPFLFSRRIRDFSGELEKLKKFFFPTNVYIKSCNGHG